MAEQVTVDVNQAEGVLETERVQGLEQASGTCNTIEAQRVEAEQVEAEQVKVERVEVKHAVDA
ncbi:MAG TPA: hypothetical protein DCX02_05745, partial [Firmicutes bacterium]|nr:hypothetical protein [Bacillota bacterium]